MRRIKQLDIIITHLIDQVDVLSEDVFFLKDHCKSLQQKLDQAHKTIRETNASIFRTINGNKTDIKELGEELSATNVRIGRIENPPKFKEGDMVEEKPRYPRDLMGFAIVPCETSTWISRSGTVVSWYYKQPGDVLATYKILAEDKKDVFELQENLLKLATPKEGETKKSKK